MEELSSFSIFKGLAKKSLLPFVYSFVPEEIPLKKVLFKEKEAATFIYFVLSGKFKVLTTVTIPIEEDFESSVTLSPNNVTKPAKRIAEVSFYLIISIK